MSTVFLMCTPNFLRPQALFFSFLRRTFNRKICKDGLIPDHWLTSFERKTMFWPMFIIWGLLWVNVQQSEATLFFWKRPPWMKNRTCVNNLVYFSKKTASASRCRHPERCLEIAILPPSGRVVSLSSLPVDGALIHPEFVSLWEQISFDLKLWKL